MTGGLVSGVSETAESAAGDGADVIHGAGGS